MFLRNDQFEQPGGASARAFGRAIATPAELTLTEKLREHAARIDWTPDLGARIGSRDWFRGLATCTALIATSWALSPGLARPITGTTPARLTGTAWDNARAQSIAPLAWGADSGRRMAANDLVRPLTQSPDRPILLVNAAFAEGDSLGSVLLRAGASKSDVASVATMVSGVIALDEIRPGTRFDMTLGRRARRSDPRPLDKLSFQPAFDFRISITRTPDGLKMQRQAIAIDDTPLRIQGLAGSSLYRAARAAGVPAKAAADFVKALATRISVGSDVSPDDKFDIIVGQRRAATGETELGDLLFAGLQLGGRKVQLVKWSGQDDSGDAEWYDANGGETRRQGFMGLPVNGRISSSFGMRLHPILGYVRMHKGMDIACPWGTPVYAVIDGTVNWAGYKGGYGNFIGISAPGGRVGTGYGHLSRIAVRSGERVQRGELVGYSGSSGLSTGPHLHFEVYRGGEAVNPRGFSFSTAASLTGSALRAFKAKVANLLSVRPGSAARKS
ncbi:MAG: M23 family metallopeptidase [Pseudomonadota bacterium]